MGETTIGTTVVEVAADTVGKLLMAILDVVVASITNHFTGVLVVKHLPVNGQRNIRVLLLAHARILLSIEGFVSLVFFESSFLLAP